MPDGSGGSIDHESGTPLKDGFGKLQDKEITQFSVSNEYSNFSNLSGKTST